VFFRHLKYIAVENSTIMSVEIEASKPAGISFNVTVVPQLLTNTTSTGMHMCKLSVLKEIDSKTLLFLI